MKIECKKVIVIPLVHRDKEVIYGTTQVELFEYSPVEILRQLKAEYGTPVISSLWKEMNIPSIFQMEQDAKKEIISNTNGSQTPGEV